MVDKNYMTSLLSWTNRNFMLKDVKGIGDKYLKKLDSLGIYTEEDLVNIIPNKYVDYEASKIENKAFLEGQICLIDITVSKLSKIFRKGSLTIQSVYGIYTPTNTKVDITFFNQEYISRIIKAGSELRVFGKVSLGKERIIMQNPSFELKKDISKFSGIIPVYATKGLISQGQFSNFIREIIDNKMVKSIIPESLENKYDLLPFYDALETIHFPKNSDIQKGIDRIAIENICKEICGLKIANSNQKLEKKYSYETDIKTEEYQQFLPFILNNSQKENIQEIHNLMLQKNAMNAILCGDVGSGKTAVALYAVYLAIKNGFQAAIMAPTEILASQHYNFIINHFNFKVAFLSSSIPSSQKKKIYSGIKLGFYDLVVGTHALLNKNLEFNKLSLVVLDEQHKFGVEQRSNLIFKGSNVDLLTLSATPIPRTMQLIAFKQSQILKIEPRVDKKIHTNLVPYHKKMDMFKYVAKCALEENKLCYVIAPLIYDDEGVELNSIESIYNDFSKIIDEKYIGVLYGSLKNDVKEKIVNDFQQGTIKILISTTVVEVGIDIKNAVNMIIIDADRFGLASLHQLRGRICRDGQTGYCFLYTKMLDSERLRFFCENSDGFKIAEKDFNLRGAGEIFDTIQSGYGKNKITYEALEKASKISEELNLESVTPYL
nr:DEAD/DEAH box helicase [Clostridia bacterium]